MGNLPCNQLRKMWHSTLQPTTADYQKWIQSNTIPDDRSSTALGNPSGRSDNHTIVKIQQVSNEQLVIHLPPHHHCCINSVLSSLPAHHSVYVSGSFRIIRPRSCEHFTWIQHSWNPCACQRQRQIQHWMIRRSYCCTRVRQVLGSITTGIIATGLLIFIVCFLA
jgi:hypothetical protein